MGGREHAVHSEMGKSILGVVMQLTSVWLRQAALESNERISETQAYQTVTKNLEKLLGIRGIEEGMEDLVIFEGGDMWEMKSKVVGIISPVAGAVHLF